MPTSAEPRREPPPRECGRRGAEAPRADTTPPDDTPPFFPFLSFPRDPRRLDAAAGSARCSTAATRRQVERAATATAAQTASHAVTRRNGRQSALHRRVAAASAESARCRCAASVFGARQPGGVPPGHRGWTSAGGDGQNPRCRRSAAASAMQRAPWLVMDAFVAQGGHEISSCSCASRPGTAFPRRSAAWRRCELHAASRADRDGGGDASNREEAASRPRCTSSWRYPRGPCRARLEAVIDVMHIMCIGAAASVDRSTGSTPRRESRTRRRRRDAEKNAHARDDGSRSIRRHFRRETSRAGGVRDWHSRALVDVDEGRRGARRRRTIPAARCVAARLGDGATRHRADVADAPGGA